SRSARTCRGGTWSSGRTDTAVPTPARSCAASSRSIASTWRSPRSRPWRTKALYRPPRWPRPSRNTGSRRIGRPRGPSDSGDEMSTLEIKVPDIGDFKDVPIIQVFVKPGDAVKPEDPLIALESDKATMDVPSPAAGTVKELKIKVGDRVSQGKVILVLDAAAAGDGHGARAPSTGPAGGNGASAAAAPAAPPATKAAAPASSEQAAPAREAPAAPAPAREAPAAAAPAAAPVKIESEAFKQAHASPSVRK